MTYSRLLIRGAIALGIAVSGTSTLAAQDWRWRDMDRDRQELRQDYREFSRDYSRIDSVRGEIARDQWRLHNDARMGRQWAASNDARELARDQRELDAAQRELNRDRRETHRDRHDLARDYSYNGRRW